MACATGSDQTIGDSFTTRFLARVPPDVAATFTPEQLRAVRGAFGMRYVMDHVIDMRRTLSLPWGRFYVVLLAGADRPRADHAAGGGHRRGKLLAAVAAAMVIATLGWSGLGTDFAALAKTATFLAP